MMFAKGTTVGKNGGKGKAYTTCTVDRASYQDSLEPMPANYVAHPWDEMRSKGRPWAYLLKPLIPGELHVASRGKYIIMAAGYVSHEAIAGIYRDRLMYNCKHAIVISLGLESHVMGMSLRDFEDITANDIPGPNSNGSKANKLRSFIVPDRFRVAGSSPKEKRTVNIMAAFVCEDYVWAIVDFARLVRIHVISRSELWTAQDFFVSSLV
jgi:hypothetical protein